MPGRKIELTVVSEWRGGEVREVEDYLAGEEPLEIRVNAQPLVVTMRTPGEDLELAAGLLLTEGLISGRGEIAAMGRPGGDPNVVDVVLRDGGASVGQALRRDFFAGSGCGICGRAGIESVRRRGIPRLEGALRVSPAVLCSLPEKLRAAQEFFGRTGALHAAGLFDAAGELAAVREDIGRHNAVDKVIGWALLDDVPLGGRVLMLSGRGGFEIVQKAAGAGLQVIASVSAPSSLAVRLARELGLTLVGFLRGNRFVIYCGGERILCTVSRNSAGRNGFLSNG